MNWPKLSYESDWNLWALFCLRLFSMTRIHFDVSFKIFFFCYYYLFFFTLFKCCFDMWFIQLQNLNKAEISILWYLIAHRIKAFQLKLQNLRKIVCSVLKNVSFKRIRSWFTSTMLKNSIKICAPRWITSRIYIVYR